MSRVQQIEIAADEAEQRIDRWFRRRWPHLSQGNIEKMCRKGEIRVDGGRVKASSRVGPGQVVRVPPLPAANEAPEAPTPTAAARPTDPPPRDLPEAFVLHRDDHIIVLNKPPGLAVQGGSKLKDHVARYLSALRFGREDAPRLVHRIDKDTSGLLVLARTGAAAAALGRAFRGRSVRKIYLAAVAGRPQPDAGTIRFGLVKAGGRGDERMHSVHPDEVATTEGAQSAWTDYRVLEQFGSRLALVALRPVTGRTHQLRAHMAAIGCPIAGDGKYANRSAENLGDGWGVGLGAGLSRRLHLHAARLEFDHPASGRPFAISAPLPEHMVATWRAVGHDPASLVSDPFLEI